MVVVRKKNLFVLIGVALLFIVSFSSGHAFVGGAHGGFLSGSYHGGGHSASGSKPMSFFESLGFICILFGFVGLCGLIGACFEKSRLGKVMKRYRQKKYLSRCRHATPIASKKKYSTEQLNKTLQVLKQKALKKLKQWSFVSNMTEPQLREAVLQVFSMLQSAWSGQNTSRVLMACNNTQFSNKLVRQIEKMKSLGVYNVIADTKITACHLVKCRKPLFLTKPILRFVVKGSQVDEYLIKSNSLKKATLSRRNFNCLIDVIPYSNSFKIHKLKIIKNVDDYVMRLR